MLGPFKSEEVTPWEMCIPVHIDLIVLFHNHISSSGEQPEQHIIGHKQNHQLSVV